METTSGLPTKRRIQGYGWKRDIPDHRDHFFNVSAPVQVPRRVDLRDKCPPVFDQGPVGSCVANAVTALFQYHEMRECQPDASEQNSRLFVYYNARDLEGCADYDSGATIRDGIGAVALYGSVKESVWPYDPDAVTTRASDAVYAQAKKDVITEYRRIVQKLGDMRVCLASGSPFAFGFTVYESFESEEVAKTGQMQMPGWFDNAIGGHAVLCVGFDDDTQRLLVRNSWGRSWGMDGHFTMPYEYALHPDLASDFWTLAAVP